MMNEKMHVSTSQGQQALSTPLASSISEQQQYMPHAFRSSLTHQASRNPLALSFGEVQFLQRTLGNRAVTQLFQRAAHPSAATPPGTTSQATAMASDLPQTLQARVEQLSGVSLDDVQVHYHSSQPADVGALAYTQGTDIYVGPGQEQHLAHEAWHVVQQKQGRVQPTLQFKGVAINDDQGLEREADTMGAQANSIGGATVQKQDMSDTHPVEPHMLTISHSFQGTMPIQRAVGFEFQTTWPIQQRNEAHEWESLPRGIGIFKDASGRLQNAPARLDQGGEFNFLIESDDNDQGGSEAEFITPPFGDQDRPSLNLAVKTMELFERAIAATPEDAEKRRLLSHVNDRFRQLVEETPDPRNAPPGPQMLHASTRTLPNIAFGDAAREKDEDEEGRLISWFDERGTRPQATFSVPLDAFTDVMEAFNVSLPAIGNERILSAARFQAAILRARRYTAGLPPPTTGPIADRNWKRLTGLLALVIGVLWTAGSYFTPDVDYVKSSFPVMLRNDFHALYNKLRTHEKAAFNTDLVLNLTGMDGNAPIFPTGFEVEAIHQAFFGPTRRQWLNSIIDPTTIGNYTETAQAGDEQVIDTNVQRDNYATDQQYEAAKQAVRDELAQQDLLSRGWVRASAYSMGAFRTPTNREVRVEWRAFRPRSLEFQHEDENESIRSGVTNVFTRYTQALTAVPNAVSLYDWGQRKSVRLTRQQAENRKFVSVSTRRVIAYYDDFDLHTDVYYDPQSKEYCFLIDVISLGGEDKKSTHDKGEYKDYLIDEVTPHYSFVFEMIPEEELAALGLNPDVSEYATIAAQEEEEGGASSEPNSPTTFRKRSLTPEEEEEEEEPPSTLKQDFSKRVTRSLSSDAVDGFFGEGTLNAIRARESVELRGQDGYYWQYEEENFGYLLFRRLHRITQ